MFADDLKALKRLGLRRFLLQALSLVSAFTSVLILWQGLTIVTNCESPIVVVLSESMEPAFSRGDLLFLTNPSSEQYRTGDITVYKIPGHDTPIVHRVIERHDVPPTVDIRQYTKSSPPSNLSEDRGRGSKLDSQLLLTKGDNNPIDDTELYRGLEWLEKRHVVGKVKGFLPYIGYVSIAMNENPQLKYALLGGLCLIGLI